MLSDLVVVRPLLVVALVVTWALIAANSFHVWKALAIPRYKAIEPILVIFGCLQFGLVCLITSFKPKTLKTE